MLRSLAVNDINKLKIAEAGAITVILDAMQQHSASAAVQEQGCAVLRNLGMNANNKTSIAAAGGIAVILDAMEHHAASAAVAQQGCGVLANLAVNETNKFKVAVAGGVVVILNAMKKHKAASAVQEAGCVALRNLAVNDHNMVRIAKAGGIEIIVHAMKQHQVPPCTHFSLISPSRSSRIPLGHLGFLEVIIPTATTFQPVLPRQLRPPQLHPDIPRTTCSQNTRIIHRVFLGQLHPTLADGGPSSCIHS